MSFANPRYPTFQLPSDALVEVWGVVSGSINPRRRAAR
ncbi:Error-prone repair protein UmuD [Methylorubrum populi]|uniref:Error-prone repair protein UmuD n=1 Tax=Methylorubrum populi TaxID=223967 RepID=A0A833J213_9HYPH|nr:Error-prone repair protein UmuD [Methylorubrum populi]